MALAHNTSIVRSGLLLHLDAANQKSYPRSGTTWTDLSGNGNNGTLTNGPTFNSANGGSIVFDGTNDFVTGPGSTISISNTFTISVWIKHNTLPSQVIMRYFSMGNETGVIRYDGINGPKQLHFFIRTNGTLKLDLRVNNAIEINNWYNVVGTWDGTTSRLYNNATQIGTNIPGGTLDGGNLNYLLSTSGESLNGNISQAFLYNRALSAIEIRQNFEALRWRYGI